MSVVSLAEYGAVPTNDMRAWAHDWIDSILDGEYGDVKSLVIVVENSDGEVNHVSQSIGKMDGYRLIGLLTHLSRRVGDNYRDD